MYLFVVHYFPHCDLKSHSGKHNKVMHFKIRRQSLFYSSRLEKLHFLTFQQQSSCTLILHQAVSEIHLHVPANIPLHVPSMATLPVRENLKASVHLVSANEIYRVHKQHRSRHCLIILQISCYETCRLLPPRQECLVQSQGTLIVTPVA